MDVPLTGAAFTHFIAFTKKAGSIVTRDLFPRCYGSNHLNTSDILLTGDELGGWKRRKKKKTDKDKGWMARGKQQQQQQSSQEAEGRSKSALKIKHLAWK